MVYNWSHFVAETNIDQLSESTNWHFDQYLDLLCSSPTTLVVVLLISWLTDIRASAQDNLFEKPASSTVSVTAVA
ncbi:MAG: hypothetical protein CL726_05595 [Chloroflexi bacterium]|nr:hypothetical protein [Chloroflexota bacterium]